jgi:hypothetical protein
MGISRYWSDPGESRVRARISPQNHIEVWGNGPEGSDAVLAVDVTAWRELIDAIRTGRLATDPAS